MLKGVRVMLLVNTYLTYLFTPTTAPTKMTQLTHPDLIHKLTTQQISKLPSKIDLYTKLAFALKQPSTRLAKTLKAAPTKLTRAIKLSFEEGNEAGGSGGSGDAPAEEPAAE